MGFVSERVVCRVKSASGRAWHAGVARARLCVVRVPLGQGPTMTRSGGGSGIVTWSVCDAWWLGSTVVRRQLLHLGLPSVGLPNDSLSSGLLQTLVPPVNAAAKWPFPFSEPSAVDGCLGVLRILNTFPGRRGSQERVICDLAGQRRPSDFPSHFHQLLCF